jgi:hypothetical protein
MRARNRLTAAVQAAYYLATGVWPLLDRRSFEAVTGPKADFWLVRTVGVLVASLGAGLALGARRPELPAELRVTAGLAAASLGAVETVYVARRRIRPIYLADAVLEAVFVVGLLRGRNGLPPT